MNDTIISSKGIRTNLPLTGSPSITYGSTTDTCCVCQRKLSRYNPDHTCASKTCTQTHHTEHRGRDCKKKRKNNIQPTITNDRRTPTI